MNVTPQQLSRADIYKKNISRVLHLSVLMLSIFLIISISKDTLENIAFYHEPHFLKVQFWICIIFLADFIIEWMFAPRKGHYFITRLLFLLVSIPYLPIIHYFGWKFSFEMTYMMQYIPLVRGGYALAIVVGWFTSNKATSLFFTYIITLLASIYFASLAFYVMEHHVNHMVKDYWDALWWAAMDVTTVGSNIEAVTPIGRILSVVLAALGMMMFPIFTVYVTNILQTINNSGETSIENKTSSS
ncbi:MAG: potassium channel family protein [Clostridium sp.]|nr:potassium channel family protein [Prevotella sp.]MCM1429295.1 potassium channel family protein [Clostridium sp.]MCM1475672.1 potassium channel family protein [Muribaculaceae bacterium]